MPDTVLLTGATGFLGSHLLEALLEQDYMVVVLKRSTSDLWRIKHLLNKFVAYDIDKIAIAKSFEEQQIDTVIHTACNYGRGGEPASEVLETNLFFSLRLLEACLKFNAATFVNTDTLLPKYLNTYTISKKQFIDWLKFYRKQTCVLNMKLEHTYGPKDGQSKFIPWLFSQFKKDASCIELTSGEQKRDFIHVKDVVSAYMTVLNHTSKLYGYNEFDVGTGRLTSIKNLVKKIKDICEAKNTELAFGALKYREGEMMSVKVNNRPLLDLGWKPGINLSDGLKELAKKEMTK